MTRDHVPGRQFFPADRRGEQDLITVPCCRPCNTSSHLDEDFFLGTFLFSDAGTTPVGQELWRKQSRSLANDRGLSRAVSRRLHRRHIVSQSGLYLGRRMVVELDHARLNRFVAGVVRGLYYAEMRCPLEQSKDLDVAPLLTEAAVAQVASLVSETRQSNTRSVLSDVTLSYSDSMCR